MNSQEFIEKCTVGVDPRAPEEDRSVVCFSSGPRSNVFHHFAPLSDYGYVWHDAIRDYWFWREKELQLLAVFLHDDQEWKYYCEPETQYDDAIISLALGLALGI